MGNTLDSNKSKNLFTYENYKYRGKLNNNNQPHGKGIILYNSGESFYCSFINGKKEGKGIYIDKNLTRYINIWKDDKVIGKVKVLPYNSNRVYYFYYKHDIIEKCIYFDNINNKESYHKHNNYSNDLHNNSHNHSYSDKEEKRNYSIEHTNYKEELYNYIDTTHMKKKNNNNNNNNNKIFNNNNIFNNKIFNNNHSEYNTSSSSLSYSSDSGNINLLDILKKKKKKSQILFPTQHKIFHHNINQSKFIKNDNLNGQRKNKMNISIYKKNERKNIFKYFSNNIENLNIENYETWSLKEVIQWLMLCNVPIKWIISFYKNNITGDKLKYININTVRNEFGIIAFGHAIKILQLIKNLQVTAYNKKFNNFIQIEEYKNYIRQKDNITKKKKKKNKETKKSNNMDKKYIDLAIHKNVKNIKNDTFQYNDDNINNCKNQKNYIHQNDYENKNIMNKKNLSFEYDNNEKKKKIIKCKKNKSLESSNDQYDLINDLSKDICSDSIFYNSSSLSSPLSYSNSFSDSSSCSSLERLPSYEKKLLSSSQSNIEHIKNLPLDVLSNNNNSENIKIKRSKSKYNNDKKKQKQFSFVLNKSSSEVSSSHSYTSESYRYNIKPSLQSSYNNSLVSSCSMSSTCPSSSSYISSLFSNASNDIVNFNRNKIIKYCNNIYMNTKLAYSYMNGFIIPHEDLIFIHPIENYYIDNTNEIYNINNRYIKDNIINHNFSFNKKNNTSFIDINTNIFSTNKEQNINNFVKYKKMKSRMFKGKYMGKEVAIKILVGKIKNFKKLHQILYNLYNMRHSNFVLIMGVSIHYPFIFIIYEYMKNKCLFSYLHCIKYKHVYISTFFQKYKTLLYNTQQEEIKKINTNKKKKKDYNNSNTEEEVPNEDQNNIDNQDTFLDLSEKSNISSDDNNSTDISQIQKENFHYLNNKIEENKDFNYDDNTSTLSDHSINNMKQSYYDVYKKKINIFNYEHNVLCGAYDNNDNNMYDNNMYDNNMYDNNMNHDNMYDNNFYDHHKNTSINSKEQHINQNLQQDTEQNNECTSYASQIKYNIKKSNFKNNIISHKKIQKCNEIQINQPYTFPPYQKELSSYLKNEKEKMKRKVLFSYLKTHVHFNSQQVNDQNDRLSVQKIMKIITDVTLACTYLEKEKMSPINLKPTNILLDDSLNAKISDFGISQIEECLDMNIDYSYIVSSNSVIKINKKEYEEKNAKKMKIVKKKNNDLLYLYDHNNNVYKYNTQYIDVSTDSSYPSIFYWTPPEILRGKKNKKFYSDIYAFGIILWQMLSNDIPFNYPFASHIMAAVGYANEELSFNNIPVSIQSLIKACVNRNRYKRPTFEHILKTISTLYQKANTKVEDALISFMDGT
ncbi:protein kinase, putative [Plasmodium sp. gorilla clade G2]|uniref:protein kinase, putative n=1 Tax=Plasmodium sp. gorilla clade G2 TaxID=880535 RepID=UPI000D222993|nr:protein kinase, putative [Plasmodium sp. gorilla clade G2]SOV15356.1 protein kinase, putative [Plasmodium sp. gorilla clade G2]